MGYLGRRIGKSQDTGNPTADGTGAGILDLFTNGYFQRQGNVFNAPGGGTALVATGGVISDYPDGAGTIYRAHVFTSSGTFDVTTAATGSLPNNVEYLVVAGGGGGGGCNQQAGGGGGAGGFRTNVSGHSLAGSAFPVSPGPYTVTVGSGGAGGPSSPGTTGSKGGQSIFGPGPITSEGGGGGGFSGTPPAVAGAPGGSGGGGGGSGLAGGLGNDPPVSPPQGNPGGPPSGYAGGGGAGGAGAAGLNVSYGGIGTAISIATGISTFYAAGGSGGTTNVSINSIGGSGDNPDTGNNATDGVFATGSGGGGRWNPSTLVGKNGGSGIVVVRYQIAQLTAAAKATGGAISYYGGKTIHTFTSTGTFNAPAPISSVEYVAIGGGGAGGTRTGGGGGAGGYTSATGQTIASGPWPIIIGAGGSKVNDNSNNPASNGNTGSNTVASFPGGTVTAGYGGGGAGGGSLYPWPTGAAPLGSGGGGKGGDTYTPSAGHGGGSPQGYYGAPGNPGGPAYGGGGGGGAGGPGGAGAPYPEQFGRGGLGRQVPSTFRNPVSAPSPSPATPPSGGGGLGYPGPTGPVPATNPGGDTTGLYWVCGGGGGGDETNPQPSEHGAGGGWPASSGAPNATPYAGSGFGGDSGTKNASSALENSGSGGGGGGHDSGYRSGGNGGSGIVLIAYPS